MTTLTAITDLSRYEWNRFSFFQKTNSIFNLFGEKGIARAANANSQLHVRTAFFDRKTTVAWWMAQRRVSWNIQAVRLSRWLSSGGLAYLIKSHRQSIKASKSVSLIWYLLANGKLFYWKPFDLKPFDSYLSLTHFHLHFRYSLVMIIDCRGAPTMCVGLLKTG